MTKNAEHAFVEKYTCEKQSIRLFVHVQGVFLKLDAFRGQCWPPCMVCSVGLPFASRGCGVCAIVMFFLFNC
jgi:hypothetical protein